MIKYFKFDNYYKSYLESCKALAKSITIKSEYNAEVMNDYVRSVKGVVEPDKRTHRYYLNLAGEYHLLDKPMTVYSVDNLELIDFTKENLLEHPATAEAYRFDSELYLELLSRFPDQELLIRGILYPVDLEVAVNAKNGQILSYPSWLIEEHERSLLPALQDYIDGYYCNYSGPHYNKVHELWGIVFQGNLYINLLQRIITHRLSKCKTEEAHSYHLRRYLTSHGFLDSYIDVMTLKQQLRFYYNIRWVERNLGKTETQYWLIREAMTERRLPISEYSFRHKSDKLLETLRETNIFRKKSLNGLEHTTEADDLTLEELLLKEDPIAKDNPEFRKFEYSKMDNKLNYSSSSKLDTKVLESKYIDFGDGKMLPLEVSLLNCWLDWSDRKIINPRTGKETVIFTSAVYFIDHVRSNKHRLKAKEAFIVWLYTFMQAMGVEWKYLPKSFIAWNVPSPSTTREDLVKMGEYGPDKDFWIHNLVEDCFINELYLTKHKFKRIISIRDFYRQVEKVNNDHNTFLRKAYNETDYVCREYKEGMVYRMLEKREIPFSTTLTTFEDWLAERRIDFTDYTKEDYFRISEMIFKNATGIDLFRKIKMSDVHRAMVALMKQLSSYSVQFIAESNESKLIIFETNIPSAQQPRFRSGTGITADEVNEIIDLRSETGVVFKDVIDVVDGNTRDDYITTKTSSIYDTDLLDINILAKSVSYHYFDTEVETALILPEDGYYADGMEYFRQIDPDLIKHTLVDGYGNDFRWQKDCQIPLVKLISNTPDHSKGFKYHTRRDLNDHTSRKGFKYHNKVNLTSNKLSKGFRYHGQEKIQLKTNYSVNGFKYQE